MTDGALSNDSLALPTRTGSRKWITAALLLVMVLAAMETTVTSTAMPTIVGSLQGLEHYSWVASVYLLSSTITMPLYGRLSDKVGRKRVLLAAIGIFIAGSALASLSRSMGQLILFRGIQGLGAGGIMPVVLTILGDIFTLQERAKIQGVFSAVWASAALAGPMLGWFLLGTTWFAPYMPQALRGFVGWPSIFWVNLPAGVAGVVVLIWKYQDHHHHHAAGDGPRESTRAILLGPILLPCLVASAMMGVGVIALDTFVPLYVQGGRGMSPGAAAACVTPVMLAWASSGVFAAPLLLRWGFRKLAVRGSALGSVGFAGLLAAAIVSGYLSSAQLLVMITLSLFVAGLGFGPASMAILLASQDSVTYQSRGIVTAAITFTRNLGAAIGVSLFGMLFNILTGPALASAAAHFSTSDLLHPHKLAELRQLYPAELAAAQATIAWGLLWVFAAMVVTALLQVVMSQFLPAHRKPDHKPTAAESLEAVAG